MIELSRKNTINREALYKNLIRFYDNEEKRLNNSIKQLQEQKRAEKVETEKLDL